MRRAVKHVPRIFLFVSIGVAVILAVALLFKVLHRKVNVDVDKRVAIVVLGGGLDEKGNVPPHTQLRLDFAFELYKDIKETKVEQPYIITLSGGTPHKPSPVDARGFPIAESTAAARALITKMHVPSEHVLEEAFSLDTLGNAYFLRVVHLEHGNFARAIIVTNDWHMPRTKAMFSHVFSLPGDASCNNVDQNGQEGSTSWTNFFFRTLAKSCSSRLDARMDISYQSVASGLDNSLLTARKEREAKSLLTFRSLAMGISDMRAMHTHMFTRHNAYATKRLTQRTHERLDPEVLKSY